VGEEAKKVFADAQVMLKKIIDEKWLTAKAIYGFYPANRVGDDIEVYADETRTEVLYRFHHIRQQAEKKEGGLIIVCLILSPQKRLKALQQAYKITLAFLQ